jgi:hypothetical protein
VHIKNGFGDNIDKNEENASIYQGAQWTICETKALLVTYEEKYLEI